MGEVPIEQCLKAARARLDLCLQSVEKLPAAEQAHLTQRLADLSEALSELNSAARALQEQHEQLQTRHEANAEAYQRYMVVAEIVQQLRQSLNPSEILDQTALLLRQLLEVDRVIIYRLKSAQEAVAVAEAMVIESAQTNGHSLLHTSLDQTLTEALKALYDRTGILVVDSIQRSSLTPEIAAFLAQHQFEAALVAPMRQDDQLIGIVCAQRNASSHVWHSYEIGLLLQVVAEAAIALQQSELYQQAQYLNADLEQQVQQRTAQLQTALRFESMLKRITDKVRDSLDEDQIIQAVVRELTLVLNLSGCNAALYDLNQGTSTIRYEHTRSIPASQGKVAQMDDFPEIYAQLQQGHYFQFCSLLPNPKRGRVAMLACPISLEAQFSQESSQMVLGDLWLIHKHNHIFHEFEIRLVQQVANQCAIAIRQARLYQTAQTQVQELEKLNRLKDEFLSTVSHELRTPITNVKMAIRMLKTAPTEEKRNEYLRILDQEANREAELINDLLDLQRLEASSFPIELEAISLPEWMLKLVEPFRSRIASQQQILQLECPDRLLPLTSDPTILRRILAELLNNACKYTAPGNQITLKVEQLHLWIESSTVGTPTTIFTIRNQAHIPALELPKIFDKFYRCLKADPWKQGGTGLGLALVLKLVERLQGTIEVASDHNWTTFTVRLPME